MMTLLNIVLQDVSTIDSSNVLYSRVV